MGVCSINKPKLRNKPILAWEDSDKLKLYEKMYFCRLFDCSTIQLFDL
jgi:hypothetical protein